MALHHLECHVDKESSEQVDQPLKPVYEPHSYKYEQGTEEYRKQYTILQKNRLYLTRYTHHGKNHDENKEVIYREHILSEIGRVKFYSHHAPGADCAVFILGKEQ